MAACVYRHAPCPPVLSERRPKGALLVPNRKSALFRIQGLLRVDVS
jgi:hypothetical protein